VLTRRIIPCLDVMDGQVVKGVNFVNLVAQGDPVELAAHYSEAGADELVFLDITASIESRPHLVELVSRVAQRVFIPFTVGGGIRTVADMERILRAGADKVTVNSAALARPRLLTEGARHFGSQCIVTAMDVKREGDTWWVYSHGGRKKTAWEAVQWATEAVNLGAGEILLTSMDADGTRAGIDLEITRRISTAVNVPVIASGGIGKRVHFKTAFRSGKADAVLAASVFHRKILTIPQVKAYLQAQGIPVRLTGSEDET
jgi:cyclase